MLSRWFSGGGAAGAAASAASDVDPTHELFLLCRSSIDTKTANADLIPQEQQIKLMQQQEYIYNCIQSILKSYPDLVHRINPVNGYNLLQTVLSNPSLANYIPLLQLLINVSEYVVEKSSDFGFDNTLNSSNSEDTMMCASPFNSSISFAMDGSFSSSPPVSPKKSFGWLYRNGSLQSTLPEMESPSKSPTSIASKSMMMQISNEIIPSQARILRDRTFTTGANCLHVLCENISFIDPSTIKFLLQSYPASVCCYDYSSKELPFHTACSSTYQYFCSGKTSNCGVASSCIGPSSIVDSLMLLLLQYPDSCKIANQDGNLPLHLGVSSMYGGKKSRTILGSNNSTTSGSLTNSLSSHHARTKIYNSKLTSDLLCEEAFAEEGDEGTDGDTASFGEDDYDAAIFCEDINDDVGDIDDNIFNRRDIDTENISVGTVDVLDDNSVPTVISIPNEKPQEQTYEQKQQPKQQERKGNLLTSLSAHLPKMIKSFSNHNPTRPTASRSISTASTHRTINSDEFLDATNTQSEIDSDRLIEVLEYLIEVYPDALYKKNQRGYTPDDLARIEYVNDPFRSHGKLQVLHYLRHAIVVADTAKISAIPSNSSHGIRSESKQNMTIKGSSPTKKMSGCTVEFFDNISLSSSSSASSTQLDSSIHDRWHNNDSTKKKKNNKIKNATRIKRDIVIDTLSNDNITTNFLNISDDDYIRLKL